MKQQTARQRRAALIRRAWLSYWRPWRVCFALGAVSGMAAMYAIDHPDATLRTVGGFLAALGVFPWIAMLVSSRSGCATCGGGGQ